MAAHFLRGASHAPALRQVDESIQTLFQKLLFAGFPLLVLLNAFPYSPHSIERHEGAACFCTLLLKER